MGRGGVGQYQILLSSMFLMQESMTLLICCIFLLSSLLQVVQRKPLGILVSIISICSMMACSSCPILEEMMGSRRGMVGSLLKMVSSSKCSTLGASSATVFCVNQMVLISWVTLARLGWLVVLLIRLRVYTYRSNILSSLSIILSTSFVLSPSLSIYIYYTPLIHYPTHPFRHQTVFHLQAHSSIRPQEVAPIGSILWYLNLQFLKYQQQPMYKKPVQPQTPNISNAKKNIRVVEKGPVGGVDRKNETNTEFKCKDDQLLAMVKEYLQTSGYLRAFETLKNERPNLKAKVQLSQPASRNETDKNHILQAFDKGSRQDFCRQTAKYFLNPDEAAKRLEFQLNIYFCVYNIHPNLKRLPTIDKPSAEAFKKYLDTKGADLSETSEFLPYFALPFMPRPQEHKALAPIFTKDWLSKMRGKLTEFLSIQMKGSNSFNQSAPARRVSQLQELYYNSLSSINSSREDCKENCHHSMEIDNLKKENHELRVIIQSYQKKFDQFTESSKVNLFESNQKWFNFSREIFLVAKKHIKEEKGKLLERYNSFFVGNIDEHIEANEISLFDKNSYVNEDLSIAPDISKQKIAMKRQEALSQNYQIDLGRIRNIFLTANNKDREVEICMVLRALKQRFTRKGEAAQRREIIIEYSRADVCGVNEENYIIQKKLLFDGGDKVKIHYLKLMEIITTDVLGLQYLTRSKKLVENLVGIFNIQREDSRCRKPVLGILQRISFSKQPRMLMIRLGIIPMMFSIFRIETHEISNFTIQFLIAMWMNLSLKRESYPYFEQHKSEFISIVIEQMTSPNDNIRNYVNGTIFLLLSSKQIRAEALKQKLDEFVRQLLDSKEDNMCTQQYNYILDRITGQEDQDLCQNQESDEEEEADAEEFQDQEYGSLSESSEEDLAEGDIEIANGEQFLMKNYALLGPEAIREQILTRSVLDETSKRLNNMTTSINRSRRVDNIFAGKNNATVLEPELDNLLNLKR